MIHVGGFITSNTICNLFDSGLANMLGLETLRHGTNPINYLSILINGGDPSHGGKTSGSNAFRHETENQFHVFKDNEYERNIGPNILRIKGIGNRIFPRFFAGLSGYNFVAQWFSDSRANAAPTILKYCVNIISCIGGFISCLITPTLRFRFSSIDHQRFENDPRFPGTAYRTRQAVEPWRIGLLGSLITGINLNWFSRIQANPWKLFTGILQVICAIAISILVIGFVIANPSLKISVAIGALLA